MNPIWSIIIPVKPGGAVRALYTLRTIYYPRERFEVIVAEGNRPSRQRNEAVAVTTGEFLYFLDDDSLVSPDCLYRAERHFADSVVAAVGGPSLTPADDTPLQQAFGATLSSLIGGGSVRNRYRASGSVRRVGESELILCNLAFRREVYLECGGLDERLYPNEENELMDRIRQRGLALIHDPELAVRRSQRPTWRAFARQMFTYGRGRGEQTVISRTVNPVSLVPSLFLFYLLLLPVCHNPVYTFPLLCYAGLVVFTALYGSLRRGKPALLPLMLLAIPTLHLMYGAGMLQGVIAPRFRNSAPPAVVTLHRVEI